MSVNRALTPSPSPEPIATKLSEISFPKIVHDPNQTHPTSSTRLEAGHALDVGAADANIVESATSLTLAASIELKPSATNAAMLTPDSDVEDDITQNHVAQFGLDFLQSGPNSPQLPALVNGILQAGQQSPHYLLSEVMASLHPHNQIQDWIATALPTPASQTSSFFDLPSSFRPEHHHPAAFGSARATTQTSSLPVNPAVVHPAALRSLANNAVGPANVASEDNLLLNDLMLLDDHDALHNLLLSQPADDSLKSSVIAAVEEDVPVSEIRRQAQEKNIEIQRYLDQITVKLHQQRVKQLSKLLCQVQAAAMESDVVIDRHDLRTLEGMGDFLAELNRRGGDIVDAASTKQFSSQVQRLRRELDPDETDESDTSDVEDPVNVDISDEIYLQLARKRQHIQARWDDSKAQVGWRWQWLESRISVCDKAIEAQRGKLSTPSSTGNEDSFAQAETARARPLNFANLRRPAYKDMSAPKISNHPISCPPLPQSHPFCMRLRASLVEPSFHPVLSFPLEAPDVILTKARNYRKQLQLARRVSDSGKKPTAPSSSSSGAPTRTASSDQPQSQQQQQQQQQNSQSKALQEKRTSSPAPQHDGSKSGAKSTPNMKLNSGRLTVNLSASASSIPSLKSPLVTPVRKRAASAFQNDHIVIPSEFASQKLEKLEVKNILTPQWKTVENNTTSAELSATPTVQTVVQSTTEQFVASTHVVDEDVSDAAYLARHTTLEMQERRKFMQYFVKGMRRRNNSNSASTLASDKISQPAHSPLQTSSPSSLVARVHSPMVAILEVPASSESSSTTPALPSSLRLQGGVLQLGSLASNTTTATPGRTMTRSESQSSSTTTSDFVAKRSRLSSLTEEDLPNLYQILGTWEPRGSALSSFPPRRFPLTATAMNAIRKEDAEAEANGRS